MTAGISERQTCWRIGFCLAWHPQRCQREACDAETEFLQRPAPRDRLGHALCQFIEFVIHSSSFGFWFCSGGFRLKSRAVASRADAAEENTVEVIVVRLCPRHEEVIAGCSQALVVTQVICAPPGWLNVQIERALSEPILVLPVSWISGWLCR